MKESIRKRILDLGADVCGFASIERFIQAPEGFHPRDLYPDCKTVIVFGFALPKSLYEVKPDLLYGHFNYLTIPKVDQIAMMTARIIEDEYRGTAVPVPCDSPYDYWDSKKMEGRGLISMKHAAVNAGIGTLGKNTLLLNKKFGNRLTVGVILSNLKLESDDDAESLCIEGCDLCLKSCPVQALGEASVIQKLCRNNAYGTTARGFETVSCNTCRSVCPKRFGE
ncbi:MAG: epoxyqueuosine reductase [Acetobacterium sp.]|nr:epoxyqueuosine reductase [Acetobacterium sp.]